MNEWMNFLRHLNIFSFKFFVIKLSVITRFRLVVMCSFGEFHFECVMWGVIRVACHADDYHDDDTDEGCPTSESGDVQNQFVENIKINKLAMTKRETELNE